MNAIVTTCIACFLTLGLMAQQTNHEYAYRANGEIIATTAPRHDGVFYRVELLETLHFNEKDPALKTMQQYGTLIREFLIDQKTTRILLGDFKEINNAKRCLRQVKEFGLNEASIIRYRNGYRREPIADLES